MANHDYWAVECKTPDCENTIYLHHIGVHEANWIWNKWALDIEPGKKGFPLRCPKCGQENRYIKGDIVSSVGEAPTTGFKSHPLFAHLASNLR